MSLLTEILVKLKKFDNDADAEEQASKWEKHFIKSLRYEINSAKSIGRYLPYEINSISQNLVQGGAYIEESDNEAIKEEKQKRLRYSDYMKCLSRVGDDQFEWLSAGIVSLFGALKWGVTKRAGDDGFDCWGEVEFEKDILGVSRYSKVEDKVKFWILGQSKNYKKVRFKTTEFRELIGSYQLAQFGMFGSSEVDEVPFKFRPFEPVLISILTTGIISANTWVLVKKSGVLAMDGEMIAEYLMDKCVGVVDDNFSDERFFEWVESFAPH